MRILFSLVLLLHGAIHLMGATKGLGLAPVASLAQPIGRGMGVLWLAAAVLLMTSAVSVLAMPRWWWAIALAGVLLSQALIIGTWSDAKWGTVVNLFALVPIVIATADQRPSSLRRRYERDAALLLAADATAAPLPVVTEADLASLPAPVARYLARAGVVGRARVRNVALTFDADMRGGPDEPWMTSTARQVEFFHPPARLFFMQASRSGVPFDVYHRYVGDAATFQVRVAGLVPMVDLAGPEMTRSETVTLFNDIVLLAPAAMLEVPIAWTAVDDTTARGRFTNAGHTVEATLTFNAAGDVVNFTSPDRSREDHGRMVPLPWDTPVSRWATFDGVRLAADAEARFLERGQWWAYGRFRLTSARFNVREP
ncbi:MAG: hypothetical protein HY275_03950 [Gemmatimonadetes bacterium]|nr:hypothetical protein [Gemmatimonadota bacterium]